MPTAREGAPESRSFLFVLGSTREEGNTETLARVAAQQLPPGVGRRWLRLTDLPLPDYTDRRHSPRGPATEVVDASAATLLEATLAATDLVIASPLYWYGVSAPVKRYLDHWMDWLELPGVDFHGRMRGRTLWGVTAMAHADPEAAAPATGALRLTARYMGMRFGGILLGSGKRPGDIHADQAALARAKTFFA